MIPLAACLQRRHRLRGCMLAAKCGLARSSAEACSRSFGIGVGPDGRYHSGRQLLRVPDTAAVARCRPADAPRNMPSMMPPMKLAISQRLRTARVWFSSIAR